MPTHQRLYVSHSLRDHVAFLFSVAKPRLTYILLAALVSGAVTAITWFRGESSVQAHAASAAPQAQSCAIPSFTFKPNPLVFQQVVPTVAVADFDGDGKQDLAAPVIALNDGAGQVAITLGKGNGEFSPPAFYPTGINPYNVLARDFSGDGKPDLAVANTGFSGTGTELSIFTNNGNGTFGFGIGYAVAGGFAPFLHAADFNGDGKLDIFLRNQSFLVFLNNGAGGFAQPLTLGSVASLSGTGYASVSFGDFNGDSKTDIVSSTYNSGTVLLITANNNNGFNAPLSFTAGARPGYMTPNDFNRDGRLDLAVSNYDSGTVSVLLNNGNGGFNAAQHYSAGSDPLEIASGDFNGDSAPDLVLAYDAFATGNLKLAVLTNNGAGGFSVTKRYEKTGFANSLLIRDINSDGKLDLLMTTLSGMIKHLTVLAGNGTGEFGAPAYFNTGGGQAIQIYEGDFNNDGKPDFVTPHRESRDVGVLLNDGAGGLAATSTTYGINGSPIQLAAADLNGDGKSDLVATSFGNTNAGPSLLLSDVNSRLSTSTIDNTLSRGAALVDLNSDNKPDLVTTSNTSAVTIHQNAGAGKFNPPVRINVGGELGVLATADFNGDGKGDVAALNHTTNTVKILLSNGAGSFLSADEYPAGSFGGSTNFILATDLNADGKSDLIVTNSFSAQRTLVLLNTGNGAFSAPTTLASGSLPLSCTAGDFNGDGNKDLAIANNGSATITILPGNGAGGFGTGTNLNVGANPLAVAAVDFNGDGKLDLAAGIGRSTAPYNTSIRIYPGNGAGGFGTPIEYPIAFNFSSFSGPSILATGDFNGDGKIDLAAAETDRRQLFILYNNCGTTNPNQAPTIAAAAPLTRPQGGPTGSSVPIATVNDAETAASDLTVAATTIPTGLSITGITNNNGTITASVAAGCNAVVGANTVVLTVTDGAGAAATANLTVNVTANTPPQLSAYPATTINAGASTTVLPNTPPSDNGTITGMTATTSAAGFTGSFSVNSVTGVVTINNAAPAGTYTITVTATDNCNATATQSFVLTVNSVNTAPAIVAGAALTQQQGSAGTTATLATVSDAQTAAGNLTVSATTVPAGLTLTNLANNNGTISATVAAGCGAAVGAHTVVLTVSDGSLSATANLTINVTANTPPVLGMYAAVTRLIYQSLSHTPAASPTDNGSISSMSAAAPNVFGPFAVNAATGLVTHQMLADAGEKVVTVTATDNCNATVTTTFPLTINKLRTATSVSVRAVANNAAGQQFALSATMTVLEGTPQIAPTRGFQFFDGAEEIVGTPQSTSPGTLEILTTSLRPGLRTITARYGGDGDRLPSVSAPISFYVNYPLASVSAANYRGETLATEQIIAAFGTNLAPSTQAANVVPLPTTLNGVTVAVRDSAGAERAAPLFFVSSTQINYLLPAGTAAGAATVTVNNGTERSLGLVTIAPTAPGVFTANASGRGLPAAQALRVLSDGSQRYEPVIRFDSAANQFVALPIDLGNANEQVFLLLYGTGWRNRSGLNAVQAGIGGAPVEVQFAGAQGSLAGLDQANLVMPRSLIGRGEVDVVLTIEGQAANTVRINIK